MSTMAGRNNLWVLWLLVEGEASVKETSGLHHLFQLILDAWFSWLPTQTFSVSFSMLHPIPPEFEAHDMET